MHHLSNPKNLLYAQTPTLKITASEISNYNQEEPTMNANETMAL